MYIILKYDPQEGMTMPDGKIYEFVEEICLQYSAQTEDIKISYGSEHILDVFRIYVQKGWINHEAIFVDLDGSLVTFNKYGNPQKFPSSFALDLMAELITNAGKIKDAEKKQ